MDDHYLEAHYSRYDEDGRLLTRHGQVEYLTTMKYIRACMTGVSDPAILEIGAGTGRYSVTLAKQGYRVTAVELLARHLEILRSKLDGSEAITAVQGKGYVVNEQNTDMLREQHLRKVEDALTEAISSARIAGMSDTELMETLKILLRIREN